MDTKYYYGTKHIFTGRSSTPFITLSSGYNETLKIDDDLVITGNVNISGTVNTTVNLAAQNVTIGNCATTDNIYLNSNGNIYVGNTTCPTAYLRNEAADILIRATNNANTIANTINLQANVNSYITSPTIGIYAGTILGVGNSSGSTVINGFTCQIGNSVDTSLMYMTGVETIVRGSTSSALEIVDGTLKGKVNIANNGFINIYSLNDVSIVGTNINIAPSTNVNFESGDYFINSGATFTTNRATLGTGIIDGFINIVPRGYAGDLNSAPTPNATVYISQDLTVKEQSVDNVRFLTIDKPTLTASAVSGNPYLSTMTGLYINLSNNYYTQNAFECPRQYAIEVDGGWFNFDSNTTPSGHTSTSLSGRLASPFYITSNTEYRVNGTGTTSLGVWGHTFLDKPNISTSHAVTISNAATLMINGVPNGNVNTTITNGYALYVNSGTSRFLGELSLAANLTSSANLTSTANISAANIIASATITGANIYSNGIFKTNGVEIGAYVKYRLSANSSAGTTIDPVPYDTLVDSQDVDGIFTNPVSGQIKVSKAGYYLVHTELQMNATTLTTELYDSYVKSYVSAGSLIRYNLLNQNFAGGQWYSGSGIVYLPVDGFIYVRHRTSTSTRYLVGGSGNNKTELIVARLSTK